MAWPVRRVDAEVVQVVLVAMLLLAVLWAVLSPSSVKLTSENSPL